MRPLEVMLASLKKITNIMATETVGLLVCGGDLNVHLQPGLDSSSKKNLGKKSLHRKVNALFEEVGLIDIWRNLFPNRRNYTHYSAPHSSYSRIDYFITFGKNKDVMNDCGTIDLSDHALIYLYVDLNLQPKNTTWKFNSSLLNYSKFKEQIKREISLYLESNDNDEVTSPILWDALKAVLRGRIIAFSSKMRNCKTN